MKNRDFATAYVIVAAIMVFACVATFVMADPNAPNSLNTISSSKRDLSTLPAQSVSAQGGNVTEISINTLTITKSWQGYYGNISGLVTLQDGSNNTFYNWSMTSFNGRVYATRVNSITWSNVNCSNASARAAEETYLGQSATDADSVSNTFSLTSHPSFTIGTKTIPANYCNSTYGFVDNNSQSTNFVMVLLTDNNNIVYGALTNKSTDGFDGKTHDFELLVGENEHAGSIGVTPYYFWTEFN